MKIFTQLCVLLVGISLTASGIAAEDPNKSVIKARQAQMQLRSFNAGPLFGMAKGKLEYNAELAKILADNLKLMLDLDNSRAWIQGTGIDNYPDDTIALPKIWTTYPEIGKYGKKYTKAVSELAAAAGSGVDALRPKVKALGASCKGCHDEFREKK